MVKKKLDKYHLKGDVLFYKWKSFFGFLIYIFTRGPSHTTVALSKEKQLEANAKYDGVIISHIEWNRHPVVVKMSFDKLAFDKTIWKYFRDEYGDLQVASKGVAILTGDEGLIYTKGADCSEIVLYYLSQHSKFKELLKNVNISKKYKRMLENPSKASPKAVYKILKVVVGDDNFVKTY